MPAKIKSRAEKILTDIDINGSEYLALSMYLKTKLWTGDLELINGLKAKGIDITISTQELFELYSKL